MPIPSLTQFRIETRPQGLLHLVFDCPGKTVNIFSNQAIHELHHFADWLHQADVRGVLIRSGKAGGFCAGADLTELGVAYDDIFSAPAADRFDRAFGHFFPLSHAIRRLETAGRPVAAAIAGVALGGGCELAMGAHFRVASRREDTRLGLPECAVGLLPGAGGTQRMPRLVGPELGLEVLLRGRTLQGAEAVEAGLVHMLADDGEEVAVAEAWLLSDAAHALQPWDRPDARPAPHAAIAPLLERHRARELARMLGHEPAPLAILDCVELGFIQPIDGAIRAEMSVFARLIQRREARNMIRTMFLGRQAYEKARREEGAIAPVQAAAEQAAQAAAAAVAACPDLALAGFAAGAPAAGQPVRGRVAPASQPVQGQVAPAGQPVQDHVAPGYWLEGQPALLAGLQPLLACCARSLATLSAEQQLQFDHAVVRQGIIPAYLGGATGLVALAA